MMEPVSALNIPKLYDQNSTFFDLIVYLFLFNGVARIALEKRFSGVGGRFLISGVGVILAVAMTIAEVQMGFTLRSFGPLAAVILLVLVGVTFFGFLRSIGVNSILSSSLSVLVIFFSLGAMAPGVLGSIVSSIPLLGIIPILAFIAAIWQLVHLLFRGTEAQVRDAAERLQQCAPVQNIQEKLSSSKEDKQILDAARSALSDLSVKEFKQSEVIIRDLEQIEAAIQRHGDNNEVRAFVAAKLRDVIPRVHTLKFEMSKLLEIDRNLARAEFSSYKKLQDWYSRLGGEERKRFAGRIREEVQKVRDEWKSAEMENKISKHLETLQYLLKRAAQSLLMSQRNESVKWIRKAIEHERSAEDLIKKIRDAKQRLVELITKERRETQSRAA